MLIKQIFDRRQSSYPKRQQKKSPVPLIFSGLLTTSAEKDREK